MAASELGCGLVWLGRGFAEVAASCVRELRAGLLFCYWIEEGFWSLQVGWIADAGWVVGTQFRSDPDPTNPFFFARFPARFFDSVSLSFP